MKTLAVVLALALAGCGGIGIGSFSTTSPPPTPVVTYVAGIALTVMAAALIVYIHDEP